MAQDSNRIADQIGAFLQSDAWRVVKYRILHEYKKQINMAMLSSILTGDNQRAAINAGKLSCLPDVVDITERIPNDINKGKLDVDGALRVIENMQREEKR